MLQYLPKKSAERTNTLGHLEVKEEEVLGFLVSTKVDKSLRPNGICPKLLKEAKDKIVGPLTGIFVSSLATGEVPLGLASG